MTMLEIKNPINRNECVVCGENVVRTEKPLQLICRFCGERKDAKSYCGHSHFICDDCFPANSIDYVRKTCLSSKLSDPIALAVEIMNSPLIKMHGPEHHFIVPAVLITCINNFKNMNEDLDKYFESALQKATEFAPDCTFGEGRCGAATGVGIFLSIFTNKIFNPTDKGTIVNSVITEAINKITDSNGPRCCKRDTYLSLGSAVEFIREKFNIDLPVSEAKCTFSLRNKSCGREDCNFYNLGFSLV